MTRMLTNGKKEGIILLFGDLFFFVAALWLTLLIRYWEFPEKGFFIDHITSFAPIFIIWTIVFLIFGLYDKQTTTLKRKLPDLIFNAEVVNSMIALAFFYFLPYAGITPKINFLLYIIISAVFISTWRVFLTGFVYSGKMMNVLVVGEGKEISQIKKEIKKNGNYRINLIETDSLNEGVLADVKRLGIKIVILDLVQGKIDDQMPFVERLLFSGVTLVNIEELYESLFGRVPLSFVNENWILRNIPNKPKPFYDIFKRIMDLIISLCLGIISLAFYPFVWIAIKLEDGGPIFIIQERVGTNNKVFKIVKFRSMTASDEGKWVVKDDPRITRVGKFLRRSRIDELPQLWNVLLGDLSLVGPRPEMPRFVDIYEKEIPYFNMRHLIKPGLSGWAQIHHEKPPQSVEETKDKLSHDLFYVKNRSLMLDIEIALKTIKTLLSRTGM